MLKAVFRIHSVVTQVTPDISLVFSSFPSPFLYLPIPSHKLILAGSKAIFSLIGFYSFACREKKESQGALGWRWLSAHKRLLARTYVRGLKDVDESVQDISMHTRVKALK